MGGGRAAGGRPVGGQGGSQQAVLVVAVGVGLGLGRALRRARALVQRLDEGQRELHGLRQVVRLVGLVAGARLEVPDEHSSKILPALLAFISWKCISRLFVALGILLAQ